MAYQALYRKWRPVTFDEVKGQDAVTGTLKNQVQKDRIGHAYLFCGTRGCGKTSVAKILSRAVNCPHAAENGGNPCNVCETCKSILNGNSMNVFEIDAASNNGVDNIRDIREQVEYPPTEGRFKVYIIDEVHMLSTGAFNALLKTLEEPPAYVIFILATTDPQKVPQTILSRCQRYDFRRMPKAAILSYMDRIRSSEGFAMEEKAAEYIAGAADGSMRDALSILDQCLAYAGDEPLTYEKVLEVLGASDVSVFSDLFRSVVSGNTDRMMEIVAEAVAAGREIGVLTTDFIWYLRNVLISLSARGGEGILEVTEDSLRRIEEDKMLLPKDRLIGLIASLAELSNRSRFSPQKRVMLEVELIRLSAAYRGNSAGVQKETSEPTQMNRQKPSVRSETASAPLEKPAAVSAEAVSPGIPQPEIKEEIQTEKGPAEKPVEKPAEIKPAAETTIGAKLRVIQENWDLLMSGLSSSNRVLFQGTVLKEERGGILIIFKNKINFTLASKNEENGLSKLSNLAQSRLGVNVCFMARVALKNEFTEEKPVITDEELKKIDFPVEVEGQG